MKMNGVIVMVMMFHVGYSQKIVVSKIIKDATQQTDIMLSNVRIERSGNSNLVSPRTFENGKLKLVASNDWTSGFFAGELWMLAKFTRSQKWYTLADSFTRMLEKEKLNAGTHDMGFKIFCSYGKGYGLTGNNEYKQVIVQSAKTLSRRFNKRVGLIRSWDHNKDKWEYPVIIDNMMNLELLFAATHITGDSSFYKMAVSHANHTMQNHFRSDYSSYHVVDYDTLTGAVKWKGTHQGYADQSAWARGQAWALYGYTMCYRETRDSKYLKQAERIAKFIMNNKTIPADAIPYWDYNAPDIPAAPRDASAAAITASALLELKLYSSYKDEYDKYARKIMIALTHHYRAKPGTIAGFILLHSTGNKPANGEVDVPINYADYYYLEALSRLKK